MSQEQMATLNTSRTLYHQESVNQVNTSGTEFYSAEEEYDNMTKEQLAVKRQASDDSEATTIRKRRIDEDDGMLANFTVEEPNWSEHVKAWGFLQSQNPKYPSIYLEKQPSNANRAGYLLGRKADCDIVFKRSDISKNHCLIYMETGANQKQKGIRIFIKDTSFNGTFVDGKLIGVQQRILLRNGNTIQLIKPPSDPREEKARHKFYRILFPPSFEANNCENVYKLTKILGRGNFAVVSHAFHRQTKEEVAIKVINKMRFDRKPKLLESIIEEVSIMMSLHHHPLLIRINNIYNEISKIYLVLEYAPGGEFFHYVVENKKLDEDRSRFIFWQLLTGIKFLHDNDIAHRDLKPENILLVDKSKLHIKISDFGLAKTEYRDKSFGSQCGTPNYVAPEVLDPSECRAYDKQCDLWSLGVVLFICLCGYPPFSEEKAPPSMKTQIKTGSFTFDSPHWDHISNEAKDMIKRLLTVDPSKRITVEEALEHDWMYMNPSYMSKMREGLGAENLEAIENLAKQEHYSLTQAPASYSQAVRP